MLLPAAGLIVAGLAIAFQQATGKPFQEVLFSGQSSIPDLVTKAGTWSIGVLALLIVCKGIAYSLSLGSFRGGPTFPGLFLGAMAGLMAGQLPGFSITPAIAVGMAAAIAAVLRLPLSAIVIAARAHGGIGRRQRATGDRRLDRGLYGQPHAPHTPGRRSAHCGGAIGDAIPSAALAPARARPGGCCTNPRRAHWSGSKGGVEKRKPSLGRGAPCRPRRSQPRQRPSQRACPRSDGPRAWRGGETTDRGA